MICAGCEGGEREREEKGLRGERWWLGARRIRSEKLREHHYREGYARSLEGK